MGRSVAARGRMGNVGREDGYVGRRSRVGVCMVSTVGEIEGQSEDMYIFFLAFLLFTTTWAISIRSLIAIKLVVGTNLLTFAYRRYATIQQRNERETEREKEMKNIEREEKVCFLYSIYSCLCISEPCALVS